MFLKVYSLFFGKKAFLVFEKHFRDTRPVKGLAVQFSIHYKPFCYSEDAFLNRLFIVLILVQLKQSKVWARCAFIQPVKANQAVNQANLELGLTEGNRYGSSEPQGTRYGSSEPQSGRESQTYV